MKTQTRHCLLSGDKPALFGFVHQIQLPPLRVAILDYGKLLALDTLHGLIEKRGGLPRLWVETLLDAAAGTYGPQQMQPALLFHYPDSPSASRSGTGRPGPAPRTAASAESLERDGT